MAQASLFGVMVELMALRLNTKGDPAFLPTLLQASAKPIIEPLAVAEWKPTTPPPPAGPDSICAVTAPNFQAGGPNGNPKIILWNVTVEGLSNAMANNVSVNGTNVSCEIPFGSYTDLPYPANRVKPQPSTVPAVLTFAGNYSINQPCCILDNSNNCTKQNFTAAGTGTFVAQLGGGQATATVQVAPSSDNSALVTTVIDLAFALGNNPSWTVQVTISDCPPDQQASWNAYASSSIANDAGRDSFVDMVNQVLGDPSVRNEFAAELNQVMMDFVKQWRQAL